MILGAKDDTLKANIVDFDLPVEAAIDSVGSETVLLSVVEIATVIFIATKCHRT